MNENELSRSKQLNTASIIISQQRSTASEIYRKVETLEAAKEEHSKAIQANKEEIEAVKKRLEN